ncbi:MAG: hypothetical protein IPO83_01895 [Chitinophagaceae bacterium]|nr:hypothetical protein [Chitinophagaceae bacterium]
MSEDKIEEFIPETFMHNLSSGNTNLPIELRKFIQKKAILGIDIYKYSEYDQVPQILVPVLFESLYEATCSAVIHHEKFFFSHDTTDQFKTEFISAGDGGYQVFDNPLQAIIFAIYFQVNTKRYLAGQNIVPFALNLFNFIKAFDLRYVITLGDIYMYHKIFYGESIISNARILSKDNLNRLLIDQSSVDWFTENINSVENLMDIEKKDLLTIPTFKDYSSEKKSYLFEDHRKIISADILKIGKVMVKANILNIYNLHLQAITRLEANSPYSNYVVTLGNLNTAGIS